MFICSAILSSTSVLLKFFFIKYSFCISFQFQQDGFAWQQHQPAGFGWVVPQPAPQPSGSAWVAPQPAGPGWAVHPSAGPGWVVAQQPGWMASQTVGYGWVPQPPPNVFPPQGGSAAPTAGVVPTASLTEETQNTPAKTDEVIHLE